MSAAKNHFAVTSIALLGSTVAPELSSYDDWRIIEADELANVEGVEVNDRRRVALEHPSALDRHAVVAIDLDGGNVSNGARRPERGEFVNNADSLEAVMDPPEHIGRQRRPAAMAPFAGLAGLDEEDIRARVMQNSERIKAVFARRFERRPAEYRLDRRGQPRLRLDRLFRGGAEGGGLAGGGGKRGEKRQRGQNEEAADAGAGSP